MNEIRRLRGVRQPMSALIVGAVLVLCAVASACNPPTLSTPPQLPECPESANWSDFFKATYREMATSTPTAGQLALSGPITDIPEFNDCQRFVVRPGAAFQFDSLFAIFARYRLDSIPVEGIRSQTGAAVIPMATIYSFHSAYPTLGIAPEFNCLYFIGSSRQNSRPAPLRPRGPGRRLRWIASRCPVRTTTTTPRSHDGTGMTPPTRSSSGYGVAVRGARFASTELEPRSRRRHATYAPGACCSDAP
jgi:hypothetical protein